MICTRELLPAPFAPTTVTNWLAGMRSDTSRSAATSLAVPGL